MSERNGVDQAWFDAQAARYLESNIVGNNKRWTKAERALLKRVLATTAGILAYIGLFLALAVWIANHG